MCGAWGTTVKLPHLSKYDIVEPPGHVGVAAGCGPPARDFAKLTALPGGRLLLFGGLDGAEKRLDDAWLFDTAT